MNSGSNLMHGKGYLPDVPRAEDPSYSSASIAKVISRTRFGKMVAGPHTKMGITDHNRFARYFSRSFGPRHAGFMHGERSSWYDRLL